MRAQHQPKDPVGAVRRSHARVAAALGRKRRTALSVVGLVAEGFHCVKPFQLEDLMTLSRRLAMLFKAKASKALDRAEDPRETLDYSYEKQLELLQQVRRGVADVATSRKRLELQAQQLASSSEKLQLQATQALGVGREDLAREALTRRSAVQEQLTDLAGQHASLQGQEDKLTASGQRLQAKVEAFRTRKETLKANYTAAEAQTKMGEAFSGISEEMGDVGLAMQRAEDKTAQMQARAGAIDELLASGALDDASGPARDPIQFELDRMSSQSNVELEMARLKSALPAVDAPAAISAGKQDVDATPQHAAEPTVGPGTRVENQR